MSETTVHDINPALPKRTLYYGKYGVLRYMCNAGLISSTVALSIFLAAVGKSGLNDGLPKDRESHKSGGLGFRGLGA